MTRPHDMGGRFGDGPVDPEPEDVKFHAGWHKRALAMTLAANACGKWNLDMSRHARESLAPMDYARFSYYEKWLAALADLLVHTDVVSRKELGGGEAHPSPLANRTLRASAVERTLSAGAPADRPGTVAQAFSVGDAVVTRRHAENQYVEGGHTRLPRYAAGATGRIVMCHGSHVLPDSNAHRLGERPEPLYAVAFPAAELWRHPEHPNDEVVLDLWQSYLGPA